MYGASSIVTEQLFEPSCECFAGSNLLRLSRMSPFPLMVQKLSSASVLTPELVDQIVRIARATYTAQWGTGDSPTPEEAKFVAQKSPEVITRLSELSK